MKTIHKFKLDTGSQVQIQLTRESKILFFKIQNEIPCIWVLLDPDHDKVFDRVFSVIGTGWDIENPLNHSYIGTDISGGYVWHCFEIV